ncbi:SURF1 family protein [Pseudomonas sp. GD03842]|uniref:SURF1 family protein n=1 Tax=Pseudomonas sp. GD03842 TaxID=2975385 RepID=UPI00244AED81|nr:SURF1 family protein [Pseudomonas sp. GD03842]MDH0749357.1 SURF1 family protein [Pseudomonas sp. GD03842]
MKRFRPGIAPTLAVIALLPVLVSLGCWQLKRGEEKRVMLAVYAARRTAPVLSAAQLPDTADSVYRRVQVQGRFDGEHSLLLDNSTRDGQAGVELIQAFHDESSGLWLAINRGWLPWPDRRTLPAFDTPTQTLRLNAWVYVTTGSLYQLHSDPQSGSWPKLVTALEPASLWQDLRRDGFAHELRLEPGPAAYRTDWPVVAMGPEKHVGYAVQWFAMAFALAGLYLYLGFGAPDGLKKGRKNNKKERHDGNNDESGRYV